MREQAFSAYCWPLDLILTGCASTPELTVQHDAFTLSHFSPFFLNAMNQLCHCKSKTYSEKSIWVTKNNISEQQALDGCAAAYTSDVLYTPVYGLNKAGKKHIV